MMPINKIEQRELDQIFPYIELLRSGLIKLNLTLDLNTQQKLFDHLIIVQKWNKIHNLTSITSLKEMIIKHTLDSLSIWQHLNGDVFLDLGSGAGFPGIPLSIAFQNKHFYLAEKSHKKQIFLTYAKNNLLINNIDIITTDVKEFKTEIMLNGVIARAFGPIDIILGNVSHLLQKNCKLYVMLGEQINDTNLDQTIFREHIVPIESPLSDCKRHLLIIERK